MSSTFTVTYKCDLKQELGETDFANILKAFIFNYASQLSESKPEVSFKMNNGEVIDVNDNVVYVKSLIRKDEDGPIDIIAQKE
jgi:hypothetical protein